MATRRTQGQSSLGKEVSPTSQQPVSSDVTPAVPADVIYKLLGFTAAMIVAPIGIYFLTVDAIFRGNSIWAAISAAVTANVILVAYIVVAWKDDQGERLVQEKKGQ
ncbi:vacuolar ATPase assembly integral membrane protein vma21 [Paecilomyces lecythidis]